MVHPQGLEGEWFTPKIGKVSLQKARNTKAKSTKKVRKSYFRTFVLFYGFIYFLLNKKEMYKKVQKYESTILALFRTFSYFLGLSASLLQLLKNQGQTANTPEKDHQHTSTFKQPTPHNKHNSRILLLCTCIGQTKHST